MCRPIAQLAAAVAAALWLTAPVARAEFITGTSSGTFVNPLPAGSFVTGVGTSNFTFGDPSTFGTGPSRLIFTGAPFNTSTETDFRIGTLSYFNGTVTADPPGPPASVDLRVQLTFSTPPVGVQNSDFRLQLINSPNTGTPDQNADAVVFPTAFSSTVFSFGGAQYTLQILGFRNVVGDGFLTSDPFRFNVREGLTASADLFGRVTANFPQAVPEPATVTSLAIGVVVLAGYARRRGTGAGPRRGLAPASETGA
jgi:hypothetical protein